MVRPLMAPSKTPLRVWRISEGSTQLLVKPASRSFSEQMKVRDSTRATSAGSENAAKEFGKSGLVSRVRVPASTSSSVSRVCSSSDPSTQWMRSGVVSWAISVTKSRSLWLSVGASAAIVAESPGAVATVLTIVSLHWVLFASTDPDGDAHGGTPSFVRTVADQMYQL